MVNKYDVIVVGAGPAGLFATLELIKNEQKVLLIDKGRSIDARICPMNKGAPECVHCNPCNVVCGWGGAGAFSDGKLTLTPEFGGNLEEYCGRQKLLSLIDEADRVYLDHGASSTLFKPSGDLAKRVITKALQSGLDIIPATIRHMGTDKSKQILGAIYETIKGSCEVRTNTMVEKVILDPDGSVSGVLLAGGEEVYADRVLLAPGREGAAWMEKTVKELGLEIESLPVDIGVRVEIPSAWAEDITDQFYEVKALLDTPTFDDKVRTFCMCPHGEVTSEYQSHHEILTVNGHSNQGNECKTENTNFAVLVSTKFTKPFRDPIGYGSHIARLANMLGGGIIVQRLGDLRKGRRSTPDRIARGLVRPTLTSAEPGDLACVLPYRHLVGIMEMLAALDNIIPGVNSGHTLLYGVEVKFYSLKVALDSGLRTSIKGLYAAGDGAGVTRGVIQASASGLWAARAMLEEK